jgi:hypothetical protein
MSMFTSLRTRFARIALPAVLVAGSLALVQPASAADFCVGQIMCAAGAGKAPDLQTALDWAAATPEADRISLSAGTFAAPNTGGFVYKSAGPVEISGAGIGQTILSGPVQSSQVLDLEGGTGTSVHDLSIQLPQMASISTGLFTNGLVKGVDITEPSPQAITHLGVSLVGNGTLDNSSVAMNLSSEAIGVALGGSATVKNSSVRARTAVTSVYGGTVERSWLTGDDYALMARGGTTKIENSVVRVNYASGTALSLAAQNDAHPVLTADGLTMISGFGGAHAGVHAEAYNSPGETVSVSVKNSIMRGFDVPIDAVGTGAGAATVNASWSDFDASKTQATGNATISKTNVSNVANPGFVNPINSNYRLGASSPLIDAGDPATPQGLDMDGNPRVTDGDLDGSARRDIGAYEVPGPLPQDPPPADPAPRGQPQDSSSATSSAAATEADPATSARPSVDTVAPVVSGFTASNRAFAVGSARSALAAFVRGTTLRYSVSEAARVTVTIRHARDGRVSGKLTRSAAKGRNAIQFSGRLGKRALRAGRYVAVLTATDAAGNRSAPKQIAFRIVSAARPRRS